MSDFSLVGGGVSSEAGYDFSTTAGVVITASGSTNTKGSYTEILSAANNTIASDSIVVYVDGSEADAVARFLIDISVGGAGSEVVLINNLHNISNAGVVDITQLAYQFPVSIPAGVRISARCQSDIASETVRVWAVRSSGSLANDSGLSAVESIGEETADTTGTIVAIGSANTFGSWVEMTSSTSSSIKGIIVEAMKSGVSWGNQRVAYQVGVGGSGNEEIIYSGHQIITSASEFSHGAASPFVSLNVPSGSRVAIRAQSNSANSDGSLDYIIYGVR